MTASFTLVMMTALSLGVALLIASAEVLHRRRIQKEKLQQRVQQLERRELAAENAMRDMKVQVGELRDSLTHTQRLLLNGLMRNGGVQAASKPLVTSRDECKLRNLLGQ